MKNQAQSSVLPENHQIISIRHILSNYLNSEIICLKTLLRLLETEEDREKREEIIILMAGTLHSMDQSVLRLNEVAYNEVVSSEAGV